MYGGGGGGGGGNWGGQWGNSMNMGSSNATRMQMQNMNQQTSMLNPNQASRAGGYNHSLPQQSVYSQHSMQNAYGMRQQQPSQNVYNMQQSHALQQQPVRNMLNLQQQQQQQPNQNPNMYLQQQQLLLQSQLQTGIGVTVPDQRLQNLQQLALGVGGYSQQQTPIQSNVPNPYLNPNAVPFYQNAQQKSANLFMQQQQQVFNQQWQTQSQVSNNQAGGQNSNVPGNYIQGPQPQHGSNNLYEAGAGTRPGFNNGNVAPATSQPVPPPIPEEKPMEHNPPPPPAPSDSGHQNDSGGSKTIVSTNLPGLLDLISGSSKKEKDPGVIPGLGDLDELPSSSPKLVHESPKPKTPELEHNSSWINHQSESHARTSEDRSAADQDVNKSEKEQRLPKVSGDTDPKPSQINLPGETSSGISTSTIGGLDIGLGVEGNPSGGGVVYTRSHLKAFDKKFRDWEKQFDEWKRSSASHPDKSAYEKFMGQWGAWREQLVQQRRFIVDSIMRNKEANPEAQQDNELGPTPIPSTVSDLTKANTSKPMDSILRPNTRFPLPSSQQSNSQAPDSKTGSQRNTNQEQCRDLSKLIRNPLAVSGAGNSVPFRPNANGGNRPSLLGDAPKNYHSNFGGPPRNTLFGANLNVPSQDFRETPGSRMANADPKNQQNPNFPRAESPVERVSRQPRSVAIDSNYFKDDDFTGNMSSFERNRSSQNNFKDDDFTGNMSSFERNRSSQSQNTFTDDDFTGNMSSFERNRSSQNAASSSIGTLSQTNPHQQSVMKENPFANQQQQPARLSAGEVFSSLMNHKPDQREDIWSSAGAGVSNDQRRQNIQADENPFSAALHRVDNPFCAPAMLQNPFGDRFGSRTGGVPSKPEGFAHGDRFENQFSRSGSSLESAIQKPNIPPFGGSQRDDIFDSIQSEIAKQLPQFQSRLLESAAPFSRRSDGFSINDHGARRSNLFDDAYDDGPAVIDYGHGKKEPSLLPAFSQPVPQSLMNDFEDDDSAAGITIDYGHGTKAPVVTVGPPNLRDPEVYNRKEPDYEEEDYLRYAEREERYGAPRREQRIAPPEFMPSNRRGPIPPPYGHYPPGHSYQERQPDPFFGLPVNPPADRPSKPLFPIGDYEEPIRTESDIRGPPVNELRHAPPEIRLAPPRDLSPISPDGSPVSSGRGRDRGRSKDLLDERGRKRDVISERAKAEDLLQEIERDRARSREREARAKARSRSRDRARSRDRDRDRVSRDRDRDRVSRDGRRGGRESPRRGRESASSPRRSRRDESPRRLRRDRTRSRSPLDLDRDRRHPSARNTSDHSTRRKSLSPRRRGIVRVEEILNMPGRKNRPAQMVIFMRGLPGSGKTHVAKLIKDRELELKESAPRILSLDDYFMIESEKTVKDPLTGKSVKEKVSTYEYDADLDSKYRDDLFKTFRKTIEGGLFSFIIVDCVNDQVRHFQEMSNFAKAKRFQVYIAELEASVEDCVKRNIHNRTLEQIKKLHRNWERTPTSYIKLDVRTMLQDDSIQDVQMEDVSDIEELELDDVKDDGLPDVEIIDPDEEDEPWATSKWETSEDKLNKLDGLARKRKSADSEDESEVPVSMEQWLQAHLPEDYSVRLESAPGKKRVRWADIEERREQERVRKYGFVVGNTNWNRLMDPTFGSSALTKTKYI